jgi:hypothetical protein
LTGIKYSPSSLGILYLSDFRDIRKFDFNDNRNLFGLSDILRFNNVGMFGLSSIFRFDNEDFSDIGIFFDGTMAFSDVTGSVNDVVSVAMYCFYDRTKYIFLIKWFQF